MFFFGSFSSLTGTPVLIHTFLLTSLISWDRCVHVYHDTPPLDGENSYNTKRSMIRTIEEAHTSDITCMSYSRDLSLIATGDTNGWIKIWDLEFCQIEGIGLGHSTEVTCMLFSDKYPCLITGDADANICIWGVRPYYPKYHVLFRGRIPRAIEPGELEKKLLQKKMLLVGKERKKGEGGGGGGALEDGGGKTEEEEHKKEDIFALTSLTRIYWNLQDCIPDPKKDPFADTSSDEEEEEEEEKDQEQLDYENNHKHGTSKIPSGDLSNLNHHGWKDKWKKENLTGKRERTQEDVDIFMKEVDLIEQEKFPLDLKTIRKKKKKKTKKKNPNEEAADGDDMDNEEEATPETKESLMILCTTDDGQMTTIDLLPYLPVDLREYKLKKKTLPPYLNSYNPWRRALRAGDDKTALNMKMREVFCMFDTDGSGDIDVAELEEALGAMGHRFTQRECAALIAETDEDNSGSIEFDEFVGLIALAQEKTRLREMEILQSMNTTTVEQKEEETEEKEERGKGQGVRSRRRDGRKSSLGGKESGKEKKTWIKENDTGHQSGAVVIQPIHSWKAHRSAVSSVVVIDAPQRFLSTSTDGTVCLWSGKGVKEGILTRGSRKDEEINRMGYREQWNFPINVEKRTLKEHNECIEIEKNIARYQQVRHEKEEEERRSLRRTSNMRMSRSGSVTSNELDKMTSGYYEKIKGSPQMKRSKLVKQLQGEVTWEENGAEIGYKNLLLEEKRIVQHKKMLHIKARKQNAPDKKGFELDNLLADDHIDPKVTQYIQASASCRQKMGSAHEHIQIVPDSATSQIPYDLLAIALESRATFRKNLNLPKIYNIPPIQLPSSDSDNWMLNSVNMQRKLYPEMYEEKDRMDAKEGKRSLRVACAFVY